MKKIIGLTGPSAFSDDCKKLIENFLNCNFIILCQDEEENINYWLDRCDGFILSGGVDVHPTIYGRDIPNHHNMSKFDIQRDLRELLIIQYAIKQKIPMLGICRGHQIIGIFHGVNSDFCLDLSNSNTVHQPTKNGISITQHEPTHSIELISNSIPFGEPPERKVLKNVMVEDQKTTLWVNSFHHQGIYYNPKGFDYKGRGIEVVGVASADKNNKIIEIMRGENWLSVQWHPEWDYQVNTPSWSIVDFFKRMIHESCK
jgi:putative glutamine amidotransferase